MDDVYKNVETYTNITDTTLAGILRSDVMALVMTNGMLLILFAILRGIFMFFMRQTLIVMSRHIEYDQKNEVYDKYQNLSISFFKSHKTGDLMSRISEDVSRVRMYTGPAIMYGMNLVVLTILCIYNMVQQNAMLTLYVLAPMPILAFTIFYVNKIINRKSEKIQANLSNVTSKAQETYAGIRVIKSFHHEEVVMDSFKDVSLEYKKSNINLALTEAVYGPAMGLFTGLSILITILVGGFQVINGNMTPGSIAEFIIYITMLTFPISAIGFTANMIQRAAVSQRRINEFLDAKTDIQNVENPIQHQVQGEIVFDNVTFEYPHTGIVALKNFNLTIKKGEKVAIMGKTGSGKSTLMHLLLRMYDVSSGEIRIDGIPIKDLDFQQLRQQMSYVPQEVFLFSDTVANNIALGVEKDMDKVRAAAKLAHVDAEILGLSNGYETVTGERGVMLSGGQKQRISIARALYKEPAILFMDDSLSAVDSKTESGIQKNLQTILDQKTCLIISHRIFKNWDFDKIIILEEGKIAEQGNHEDLMLKNGYYAKLYRYQTEEEQ